MMFQCIKDLMIYYLIRVVIIVGENRNTVVIEVLEYCSSGVITIYASPPPNDIGIVDPGFGWPLIFILPKLFSYLLTFS